MEVLMCGFIFSLSFIMGDASSGEILIPSPPSQGMDDPHEIFRSWGLCHELISIVMQRGIHSVFVLKKMEIEDVDNFFDRLDDTYFGERIKFKAGLREWRKQQVRFFLCILM